MTKEQKEENINMYRIKISFSPDNYETVRDIVHSHFGCPDEEQLEGTKDEEDVRSIDLGFEYNNDNIQSLNDVREQLDILKEELHYTVAEYDANYNFEVVQ